MECRHVLQRDALSLARQAREAGQRLAPRDKSIEIVGLPVGAFGTKREKGVELRVAFFDALAKFRGEFARRDAFGSQGFADGADQFYGTPALSRVRDYSADGARRSLDDSLRRLRLDRVDIALIHDPDEHLIEALDGAYPALAGLRADGTVGAIGVGVNSASLVEWFVTRCDLDCVLVAGRYTLLDDSAARSLFPTCLARGVAVLAGGVFNSGILAGGDRYDYALAPPGVQARARRIGEVCARYDVPVVAAALRYVLRHPAVTAAVVGARTPEEIRADAGYLSLDIPDALWSDLADLRP